MVNELYCPNCGTKIQITAEKDGYACGCTFCGAQYHVNRFDFALTPKDSQGDRGNETPPSEVSPYQDSTENNRGVSNGQSPYSQMPPQNSMPDWQAPPPGYAYGQAAPPANRKRKAFMIAGITISVVIIIYVAVLALYAALSESGRPAGFGSTGNLNNTPAPSYSYDSSEEKEIQTLMAFNYEVPVSWKKTENAEGAFYALQDGSYLLVTYDDSDAADGLEGHDELSLYLEDLKNELGLKETRRETDWENGYPCIQIDFSYIEDSIAHFGIAKAYLAGDTVYLMYYDGEGVLRTGKRTAVEQVFDSIEIQEN